MRHKRFYLALLLLLIIKSSVFSEGSKELYITTHTTGLYCCNDFAGKCNPWPYNGDRSQFAVYDCNEEDRLYFITVNPSETVYMGFNGSGAGMGNHLVFQIKDMTGTIVYAETSLPAAGTGFIPTIAEARVGPLQIYGAGGYTALNWHPMTPGTYYIEFNRKTAGGVVSTGGFQIDLFDITIRDTVTSVVKTGRLHCKAWQFTESQNCSAKTYVYSNDSIITSAEFNNMDGGTWIQFCNQWGCTNTGNFAIDRKSLFHPTTATYLPQYKIFLNPPDQTIFPPATTLGQVVAPAPWGERICTTGHIIFHVNVDKPGNVEINLSFGPPYADRKLPQAVVVGENLIDWDGLDGTIPTPVPVPNNTSISFSVSYINGLTNMPFFDVEGNSNGFTIGIVAPAGSTPLVYWDDLNIAGGTSNLTGCLSPGCHTWNANWGNLNTVNTWWFNVSSSLVQPPIIEYRDPGTLVFQQVPPQNYCENTSGHVFSVIADPNADAYHWSYAPAAGVTWVPSGNSVTVSFGPGAASGILSVYGSNTNCSTQGPTSNLAITINPAPLPVITGPASACVGSTGNSYTTQPGMTGYIWTVSAGGMITSGAGTNNIQVTWNTVGSNSVTVNYTTANGCTATNATVYPVTVNPLPVPTIAGATVVCEGVTGETYTTQAGKSNYLWSVPSGATTTGGGGASDDFITLTWTTPGNHTVSINYTDANGCTATAATTIGVTVNPLPNVVFTYNTPGSCSGLPLNIQLSSGVPGSSFTWNATGSSGNVSPQTASGNGNITNTFSNTGPDIEYVVFSVDPAANGCSPASPVLSNPVPVYPVPGLITVPSTLTVCSNSPANVALSSNVQNAAFSWTATGGAGITPATVSGNGNIAGTFQNSGAVPAVVSFAIVPSANGCSNPGLPPYLLTVNPKPTVIFPASPASPQTICSGTSTATVNLQSNVTLPGVTYGWTATAYDPVNPTPGIAGFTTPNNGNSIPGENITSTLLVPGLIKYQVTASFTGGGAVCPGDPAEYQVIVNPSPTVALSPPDPAGQTICSGSSSQLISFTPNVTPITYSWQAVEVTGVNPPVMSGTTDFIPAQTLTVTGATQGHVKYKVTPTYVGGGSFTCSGGVSYSTIYVNPLPAPAISSATPQTLCEYQTGVIYTTPDVAGNSYAWTVTGASTVTNANTSAVTVNWGSYTGSPGTLTVREKINATGCEKTSPVFSVILQQRPIPTLTGPQTLCEGASGQVYQTEAGMSNYTWTIAGGSITGGGTAFMNTATVTWTTPGSQWIEVNYINGLGCPGFPAKTLPVTVSPLPVSAISEGAGITCQLQTHAYFTTADAATAFAWSILPPSSGTVTTGQGTNSIVVTWLTSGNATVALTATKTATGCSTSSTFPVVVHPSPVPEFTACFDVKTTPNAKKFTLRGGTPYLTGQGVYSGNRVSYNAVSGKYEFDPSGAGTGAYPITYTYTNTFGCTVAASTVTINVVSSPFTCGGNLTDVRDGKVYKTSLIGSKCWMRENLAYGTILDPASQPQTDNCISEKYCLATDATCSAYGGLYQWDELMAYASTSAGQGLCPPEWHIPTVTEWQTMINTISSGITPPVDGLGGNFLKDQLLNPGFHALVKGIYYLNNSWAFTGGSLTGTMFWTSTPSGTERGVARGVNSLNPSVSEYPGSRGNAFSVRCVKD